MVRHSRKLGPGFGKLALNTLVSLLSYYVLCWIIDSNFCVQACQPPLRPIYNATQRQYVSCNAWEPECPYGSYCQMATTDWKTRLQINTEFTLFLCCADEEIFKNSNSVAIVVPNPPPAPAPPQPQPVTNAVAPPPPPPQLIQNQQPLGKDPSQPEAAKAFPIGHTNDHVHGNGNGVNGGNDQGHNHGAGDANIGNPPRPSGVVHQPPTAQKPGGPVLSSKQPILPPQAQIVLPGNGNRIIDGPQVIQLIVGEMNQSGPDGMYKYSGSVSLVQDSGLNILVDSGSAQNRNKLLAALAQQGIKPQNIQLVVYTHAHPDHIGNDNIFPYAQKLYSTTVYKGDEYMPLQYMQEPNMRLTQNVEVWQTPGHTYQHNSIIVRNVPNEGSVAITGDLFMNEADTSNQSIWQAVSVDKEVQAQMRNLILCHVDYIIPGHGSPFRVSQDHKAGCNARRKLVIYRGRRTKTKNPRS